ncbi:MAG: HAMP domain-containing histidine kinase [Spirochaetaceae bacterium]
MFLNKVNVRIALTFTLFSTMISVILFSSLSFLIIGFLRIEDYKAMGHQLQIVETFYEKGGRNLVISQIVDDMFIDGKKYFIRILTSETIFDLGPDNWKKNFNYDELDDDLLGEISTLYSDNFDYNLDVLTYITPSGVSLQIGISDKYRYNLLDVLNKVFIILLIPLLLISLMFGLYYSTKTLKPVLDLTRTIKTIIKTGKRENKTAVRYGSSELSELVTLFNTLLDNNDNLIKGMKETLDNVSHDLRTPLTRIRGAAEVALTSSNPDELREAHSDSIEEIDSIIKMLNALLDITASENGVLNLDKQEFNIKDLLESSIDMYNFVAEDKMIKLLLSFNLDSEIIFADEIKFRQVVANLLDNAVKYSDKGGVIDITIYQDETNMILKVKDSGIGISQDEIENIWDRLFRSTRSRNEPGLGLGLSMVKAIIVAHNGSVVVKSELHVGSTFIVCIPLQISNIKEI